VAIKGLKEIYKKGFRYKKAGVMLGLMTDKPLVQSSLFEDHLAKGKSVRLMKTLDSINTRYGAQALRVAATGTDQVWKMKSENVSPKYTSHWDQLPLVS
jgi:DNA polymerase V